MIDIASRVVFTEQGHVYRLDGVVVPSITQALVVAQYDQFDFVRPQLLALRAAEGTMLHSMVESYEKVGEFDLNACAETDEQWEMMVELIDDMDAYIDFKRKTGFVVSTTEQIVASAKYSFAGRLDLTGHFPGDPDLWVIDIKRTAAIPKSVGLQTAAQEIGLRETLGLEDSVQIKRGALHLRHGKHKLAQLTNRRDRATFLSCLNVTHWRNS